MSRWGKAEKAEAHEVNSPTQDKGTLHNSEINDAEKYPFFFPVILSLLPEI